METYSTAKQSDQEVPKKERTDGEPGENREEEETMENGTAGEGKQWFPNLNMVSDCKQMAREALDRLNVWEPSVYYTLGKESFFIAGHEICIRESLDSYGALIWPGAVALSQFLANNRQQVNLLDKAVLEIGAGTGLLSIVASLLGAWVTATDLPEILPNLTFNLSRNSKSRCRYTPQVRALTWGQDLERDFPCTSCRYDYVLAADVVYHHDYLEELLATMRHFCRPASGTTLLWANKVRFQSDLRFKKSFESCFSTTLLTELKEGDVRIYKATARE
ncbi:protein-lysine methyltransferase METTL21C-like isoform X1 [Oncorhynchus keta]|uniref:protein-lysine methyltransferase METTL21C-like isoform X1 n=1 Tax=Oncorhynchus keta TaxID=8018 RepID=UPI0015F83690|nr:protein-lysine methyltransferase METTL21C-like isoform X1 [Oncorhynchus keta]XP_035629493.1 protein-lysine methyltransferase METTL21C-like isoform X1 [Oncorhynchus keta]